MDTPHLIFYSFCPILLLVLKLSLFSDLYIGVKSKKEALYIYSVNVIQCFLISIVFYICPSSGYNLLSIQLPTGCFFTLQHEVRIDSFLPDQLLVVSSLHDPPIIHHQDLVCVAHGL